MSQPTNETQLLVESRDRSLPAFETPRGLENRLPLVNTETQSVCERIVELGRLRKWIIRRQWLLERPSVQQISSYMARSSDEFSELSKEKHYGAAAKLRTKGLKLLDPDWATWFATASFSEQSRDKLRAAIVDRNGVSLTQHELDTLVYMGTFLLMEQQPEQDLANRRKEVEKQMEKLAEQLPVAKWWCSHRGMNLGGLSKIIAETGDLNNYPNPDKVKRRLGLAPFQNAKGTTKAGSTWRREGGLTAKEWEEFGYSPLRRSTVFTIGDSIIKARGEYRAIYDQEKTARATRYPDHTPMRIHRHAQRVMEQRIIIDLWAHWTNNVRSVPA